MTSQVPVPWSQRCEARDCEQAHTTSAPLRAHRYQVCDRHAAEFAQAQAAERTAA